MQPPRSNASRTRGLLAPVAAVALCTALADAQTITSLGVLPGRFFSRATALSADGTTVVGISGGVDHAFRWTLSGGMQDLGALTGASTSIAYGCSLNGAIVGGNSTAAQVGAFRWSVPTGILSLGLYYPGSDWTECLGVSGDGVTFFGQTRIPGGTIAAYRWTVAAGFQLLGTLTPLGRDSTPFDATPNASYICGTADVLNNAGPDHAFRWSSATGMQDIGQLVTAGYSYANAISDNGRVIAGTCDTTNSFQGYHATLWQDEGGGKFSFQDLGVPNGYTQSYVSDLSADGSVVIGYVYPAAPTIWTQQLGWRFLAPWLSSVGVNMTGWTLGTTARLSADGTAIAGTGTFQGQERAYVVRNIPCLHAPTITNPLGDVATCSGATASYSVGAGGTYTGNLTYSWTRNNVPIGNGVTPFGSVISGATTATLTISNLSTLDAAAYAVTVTNPCGSATSSASLAVGSAPTFVQQPVDTAVCTNLTGTLSVTTAIGHGVSYSWYAYLPDFPLYIPLSDGPIGAGTVVAGAHGPTLTFNTIQPDMGGYYVCRATTSCGTSQSNAAYVTVVTGPPTFSQTGDETACIDGPFFASVAVFPSSGPVTYQWQREVSPGSFVDLANGSTNAWDGAAPHLGGIISGVTTPTLTLVANSASNRWLGAPHAIRYRCVMVNACNALLAPAVLCTVCIADYDCSGAVNSQDFFNYLAAFFAGVPRADLDHDGNVTSADFFLFLQKFFSGC